MSIDDETILDILALACGDKAVKTMPDMDLFANDTFDSLAMITFINELEDRYHIELQPASISRANWQTPHGILKIVHAAL